MPYLLLGWVIGGDAPCTPESMPLKWAPFGNGVYASAQHVHQDEEGEADQLMDPGDQPGPANVDGGPQENAQETTAEKLRLTTAQDRASRFLQRQARQLVRWKTLQEMEDLDDGEGLESLEDLKIAAEYPYDRETLRLAWNLHYGAPDEFLPDETIKDPVLLEGIWGPILRLGDVSSDRCVCSFGYSSTTP